MTPGNIFSTLTENKRRFGIEIWERYGSDFVYENGKWLYFHEQVCCDFFFLLNARNWEFDRYIEELEGRAVHGGGGQPKKISDRSTELCHLDH